MIFWYQSWLVQTSGSDVYFFYQEGHSALVQKNYQTKAWHIGTYTQIFSFLVQWVSEILISKVLMGGSPLSHSAMCYCKTIEFFEYVHNIHRIQLSFIIQASTHFYIPLKIIRFYPMYFCETIKFLHICIWSSKMSIYVHIFHLNPTTRGNFKCVHFPH